MKLPKRLPYEFAIAAAIMLGSCQSDDAAKLDRADINARNAIARQPEIIDRLDRLEQRADAIESRLNM